MLAEEEEFSTFFGNSSKYSIIDTYFFDHFSFCFKSKIALMVNVFIM